MAAPPVPSAADYFALTRLLLVPSVWEEPFGRVAAEAMINGVPPLVANRGSLPDVLGRRFLHRRRRTRAADPRVDDAQGHRAFRPKKRSSRGSTPSARSGTMPRCTTRSPRAREDRLGPIQRSDFAAQARGLLHVAQAWRRSARGLSIALAVGNRTPCAITAYRLICGFRCEVGAIDKCVIDATGRNGDRAHKSGRAASRSIRRITPAPACERFGSTDPQLSASRSSRVTLPLAVWTRRRRRGFRRARSTRAGRCRRLACLDRRNDTPIERHSRCRRRPRVSGRSPAERQPQWAFRAARFSPPSPFR